LCIPKTMRRRILHEAHDTPAGGHFGADRTYLAHERPVFLEANMARYPVLRSGLRLMPSNQSPERETQGPPTSTSCSRRPLAENRH
jgi:hypothetical protein